MAQPHGLLFTVDLLTSFSCDAKLLLTACKMVDHEYKTGNTKY